MKVIFIISFICYFILEILLLIKLKSKAIAFKSTATTLGGSIILVALRFFFNFTLPFYILLLTIVVFALNSYVGHYLNYFNRSKVFDRFLHSLGAFTFSLLSFYLLGNIIDYGGSEIFMALYIFLLGVSLGAIYETLEYYSDKKGKGKMQKGLKDTNMDMLGNLIGSLLSASIAYWLIL